MRTKLCLTVFFLMNASILMVAQPDHMPKEGRDRIEAQRAAFITQHLDLTPEEATKFWPIYNSYKKQLMEIRKDFERPNIQSLSDKEAMALIDKQIRQEQDKLDIKAAMLHDLSQAIPPKKVLMLHFAENMFNKELLRKLQERRKQ